MAMNYLLIKEEWVQEWMAFNRSFRLPDSTPVRTFFHDLCWAVVRGDLPHQICEPAIGSMVFHSERERDEAISLLADKISRLKRLELAVDYRARLDNLAKFLLESSLVPIRLLQDRRQEDFLFEVELTRSLKAQAERQNELSLIYALPNELILSCFMKVPRRYHLNIGCVSRRWRALTQSAEWASYRRKEEPVEMYIFVMCRKEDGSTCFYELELTAPTWKPLVSAPSQCHQRVGISVEVVEQKLFILGGRSFGEGACRDVFCFNTCANGWEMAPPLPTARSHCASAALNKHLYVAGGIDESFEAAESWDIYNVNSNSWSTQYPSVHDVPSAFFSLDDKVYTIHNTGGGQTRTYAGVYSPSDRHWQRLEGEELQIKQCCGNPTIVLDGTFFMLEGSTTSMKLMRWSWKSLEWVALCRVPPHVARPPCRLVAVGKTIFIVGKGLKTWGINVEEAPLICSLITDVFDEKLHVICCKSMSM